MARRSLYPRAGGSFFDLIPCIPESLFVSRSDQSAVNGRGAAPETQARRRRRRRCTSTLQYSTVLRNTILSPANSAPRQTHEQWSRISCCSSSVRMFTVRVSNTIKGGEVEKITMIRTAVNIIPLLVLLSLFIHSSQVYNYKMLYSFC